MGGTFTEVLFVLILILINGYFAAAEIALISARKSQLQQRAEKGSRGAQTALKLTQDPTSLLATIQVAITLVGTLASATAAVTLAVPLRHALEGTGVSWLANIAPSLSVLIVTLIISYVTLVLGELVPKRLGMQRADGVASSVARPLNFLSTIAKPVVWLLAVSTKGVARLLGVKGDDTSQDVSEDELQLMVSEQETLEPEEKRMISEIIGLGDTVVREIMVPRVDMMFVEDTKTVAEAAEYLYATGFSRAPIFHEDFDKIVGILVLKDLVIPLSEDRDNESVSDFMHEPVFVPETKDILAMLEQMQEDHFQLAVIVDEYGGTSGMITMEDIVEEVVGDFADEMDRDTLPIRKVSETEYVVAGDLDTSDAIDLGFPVEESDEYDTLAGWLLEQIDHIPHVGERYEYEGALFTVVAMRRRRIARIRVQKLGTPAEVPDAKDHKDAVDDDN